MRASRSIATRLAVAIALILLMGGVLVIMAALAYGRQAADRVYDKLLSGAALEIARAIEVEDGEVVVDLPVSAFEILALAPDDRVFYRVLAADGATLTGYPGLPAPEGREDGVVFYNAGFRAAPIRLAATRRVIVERAFVGDLSILVGQTLEARSALAWDIAKNALVVLALAGAMLIALAVIAVRSSLAPLRRIEQALLLRDPSDLTPLDVDAPREVETMVSAIDRFMARLANRVSAMQNMIADATHQLRTPVAAMRAQAELAKGEKDEGRLRQSVDRIHRRAVSLSRLTDQLLNQALVIHRADAAPRQALDLRHVAVEVAEVADHDHFASGATLLLDLPEDEVTVVGDPLSLVEATKNLVNNAFRYGRAPITLLVGDVDGEAAISVVDRGEGIAATDWPDRLRRFSATSSQGSEGAGLGLSIVGAVAEAHGGRLEFAKPESGGFVAALVLPRRRGSAQ